MNEKEELLSKKRALELFDNKILNTLETGTSESLIKIHKYLFQDIYKTAGELRSTEISKGGFRFTPAIYLEEALKNLDKMPYSNFDEIVEKYVEMNILHPFNNGNGRSMRIWLDCMLKKEIEMVVDWTKIEKGHYIMAMERSPIKDIEIKYYIGNALTEDIDSREVYVKRINQSWYYEGQYNSLIKDI